MKKLIILLRKFIGEILTIIGSGVFTYNIFNFSNAGDRDETVIRIMGGHIGYYYHDDTLKFIALGAMLIATGLFIIKYRNK